MSAIKTHGNELVEGFDLLSDLEGREENPYQE
jgi:hypothetical protein